MSSLTISEKTKLEKLLDMSSGYVSNFSNSTFGHFFSDSVGIDIHSEKYSARGESKANKLREFWRLESDHIVGTSISDLLQHLSENVEILIDPQKQMLVESCEKISQRLLSGITGLENLKKSTNHFDAHHLADQISRLEKSIESDPALAIGTAKELIETCCKTILAERGKPVKGTPDIPTLTKETLKELQLVPEGITDKTRGSETIKRILQNLGAIGNGLAELRGLYGTGHGKHAKAVGLNARHARLAVSTASALATFLFDTHTEKAPKKDQA